MAFICSKKYKYFLIAVIILFFIVFGYHWIYGFTISRKIEILLLDRKFGNRIIESAIEDKDEFIFYLDQQIGVYRLNGRSALWLSEILYSNTSDECLRFALKYYEGADTHLKLVSSVVLLSNNRYPEDISDDAFIIKALHGDYSDRFGNDSYRELAAFALGKSGKKEAVPYLMNQLRKPDAYFVPATICDALREIGDDRAVPALEDALKDPNFYAIPEAFKALVCLKGKNAIELAISRVDEKYKRFNSGFIVNELEEITGQEFGYDQRQWQDWWNKNKKNFVINNIESYCLD